MKEEQFIAVFEDSFNNKFCEDLINYFEVMNTKNMVWSRNTTFKTDRATSLNTPELPNMLLIDNFNSQIINEFNDIFWSTIWAKYVDKYSIINDMSQLAITGYKIQKTNPTEGYHVWHCENDSILHNRRVAVYVLYLNDIYEGGETEFLYQSIRVQPKVGTLVLFPASYTHVHRGNPPLKNSKYILTGWVEYV